MPGASLYTRKVFKSQKAGLPFSRNAVRDCAYCHQPPTKGEKPMVCAKCKATHYCSREHQVTHWKEHKPICTELAEQLAQTALASRLGIPGAADATSHQRSLSDFDDIHEISIVEMVASALHAQGAFRRAGPINMTTHHIALDVRSREEGDGNPARTFELLGARIAPNAEAMQTPLFKANLDRMAPRRQELSSDPDYITGFLVVYKIGQTGTWISNCAVMLDSLREYNVPHERWEAHLKRRINRGPVFRIVIKRDASPPQQWVFGVLEPQGDNWVWKKKTRDELQALGIPLFERDDSEAQASG